MIALAGPLHLLAVVLVVSGIGKLIAPQPAADAMRDAALPVPFRGRAASGVGLGAIEASVGLVALSVPTWWAAGALGAVYLGFAGFILRLRAQDGAAGCGCFGSASTPPGTAHLVVNIVAAVTAFATAALGVPDIVDVFDDGLGVAIPYVSLLAVGAALVLVGPALSSELGRVRSGDLPRAFAPTHAGRSR